jgi:hypothetical protein
MAHEMSQLRATANEHLRRDTDAGGKWVCSCQACHQIRSLVGMEKTLEVRPLVREIEEIEQQLVGLQDGPEKRSVLNRYFKLYDQLADLMAKS